MSTEHKSKREIIAILRISQAQNGLLTMERDKLLDAVDRLLNVARGCHDYGGGYFHQIERDAFHHGIQTVINALEAAAKNDPHDGQINALELMGRAPNPAHATGAAQSDTPEVA